MKPLNSNMHLKPEEGCTKISSSCVVWQGPDIPCINLCKGDTITDVVYKLAMHLCEITDGVIDITTLDFKCLVAEGIANPTSLIETIQLIIDKQCFFEENCCSDGAGGSVLTPISLPACLYFTEDGDEITALLPADYSQFLANKICDVLTNITSIQLAIANLQSRVTILENAPGTGETGTSISVVAQCASHPVPGTVVPIGQAFSAFENKFCQLTSLLGTSAALTTAIGKECAGLDTAEQLVDSESVMSDIPGWVVNPTTLSETIVNMWLTICDMRTAIQLAAGGVVPGCVPLPVSNIQITNVTSTGSTITWSAPSVGTNESPLQYNVKAFEWDGTTTIGAAILNVNVPFGTNTCNVTSVPDPTKNYQIQIIAEYSCEDSIVSTFVGKLALTSVIYCVGVTDVAYDEIIENCDGDSYTVKRRKTTLTLRDITTNAPLINAIAPFTVDVNYDVEGDCPSSLIQTVTKTFNTGVGTAEIIYEMERYIKCVSTEPCTVQTKMYNCIGPISSDRVIACDGETTCPV